ncbi:hypothetical protein [Microbacterium rhizomatis]|uniref:Uncharacterized protein n=1 Tax=Microbacterium rhizomatis TaxID=1631477 RepID=A0A5J5IWI1_9MICO|nr:hypothetical protein [Microbacterium rhizomatis]KAA9105064.1 hypothetical protein F6B43_18640 [Microbacterium rhizomatis]
MTAVSVWIDSARGHEYDVAVAELPVRARRASVIAGAIAVVDGLDGVRAAVDADASAIVLAEVGMVGDSAWAALGPIGALPPVIVDRRLLRADAAGLVRGEPGAGAPRFVTVELIAPRDRRDEAIADAVGWARELAGSAFAPVAVSGTPGRSMALLIGPDAGSAFALTVSQAAARARGVQLRATAVAEERREVTIDEDAGILRISRAGAEGESLAGARRETRARLALRRAIDALAEASSPTDLADLTGDRATARTIIAETGAERSEA